MGHVIGLSKYYFPIYEKIFRDAGIPAEIEYLSIVESKLDPNAISRVGATGPWQFMGTTAKMYGLNMDGYIDERRDPVRASYAAAAYLKDAYEEFGDWLLAIASYNCGKSNIENAMAKAGGATDFWTIRQYLPVETRNYVPAYIAVAYVMNYYSKHNITAQPCSFSLNIDTVLVDRQISLNNISNILGVDAKLLSLLNPAYRMQVINASAHSPRRLIIPQTDTKRYAALYDALNNSSGAVNSTSSQKTYVPLHTSYNAPDDKPAAYHKVKRGETLAYIADTYGVDVNDLKTWNHLHHNKAVVGQRLKISRG
jgi:membrane-bound lytic murein transglycosylase D